MKDKTSVRAIQRFAQKLQELDKTPAEPLPEGVLATIREEVHQHAACVPSL